MNKAESNNKSNQFKSLSSKINEDRKFFYSILPFPFQGGGSLD